MERLLSRALRNVPNWALCNPILEVSVYPTEGESLTTVLTLFLESVVVETPVVAVVVVDANAMLGGKLLKSVFGGNSFDGGIIKLVVHETQSGVIVNKDGAASVPLLGEFPFQLGKESHFG